RQTDRRKILHLQGTRATLGLCRSRPKTNRFRSRGQQLPTRTLYYVYNFLGLPPEYRLSGPAPSSGQHIVGVEFIKDTMGEHHEAHRSAKLSVDDKEVASSSIRTHVRFSLCGEGLCIGYDSGDAVSHLYKPPFRFTGGTIHKVVFDVAKDAYVDLEKHLLAAIARD